MAENKWLTVLITLVVGVITQVISGRGPTLQEWNITPEKYLVTLGHVFFCSWQIGECPPSIIQLCKLEWVDEFLTNTNWSWLKVLVVSSRSNRDVCRKMTWITNPRDLAASIAAYLFFCEWHTHRDGAVWKKQRWQKIYPNRPNSGDALMVSLVN